MTTTKPRILTGDTPTSTGLHLGHFVGSIENRLALQDQYECYFLIANVHAFTTLAEKPSDIRANTMGIVKDWLAVGLDPSRSTFVLQSEIPAIAELTFLLAMLIPFNKVMRNPTLKTEMTTKDMGETYPFGFPMYAVGQCADILAFRPELVPVGEDQEAHIEMCRDVALKFNQLYCGVNNRTPPSEHHKAGGVFPIPSAKIGRVGRLIGLDGVQKMSKSLGNAIGVNEPPGTMFGKVMSISDELMARYYALLLGRALPEGEHPMAAKKELGRSLVARFHSADEAARALEEFEKRFSGRDLENADLPPFQPSGPQLDVITAGVEAYERCFGQAKSRGDVRRLVVQGSVQWRGEKVTDPKAALDLSQPGILRLDKTRAVRVG